MVETCDNCACFPVCDRKFNMFGVFMGWADCNNWIPEVKRGKWMGWGKSGTFFYENYGTCSVCHEDAEIGTEHRNYCPNCGARMCKE